MGHCGKPDRLGCESVRAYSSVGENEEEGQSGAELEPLIVDGGVAR